MVIRSEQRRPVSRFQVTQALVDLLGTMYERAELSQNQVDRFFEKLCLVEFVARPTVIRGRDCPVEFRWKSRAPSTGVWAILAPRYDPWSRDHLGTRREAGHQRRQQSQHGDDRVTGVHW